MASYRTPGPAGITPTSRPSPRGLLPRVPARNPGTIATDFRRSFQVDDFNDTDNTTDFTFSLEQPSDPKSKSPGGGTGANVSGPAAGPPNSGAARGSKATGSDRPGPTICRLLYPGQVLTQQKSSSPKTGNGPATPGASGGKPNVGESTGAPRKYLVIQSLACLEVAPPSSKDQAAGPGAPAAPGAKGADASELLMPPDWQQYVILLS